MLTQTLTTREAGRNVVRKEALLTQLSHVVWDNNEPAVLGASLDVSRLASDSQANGNHCAL